LDRVSRKPTRSVSVQVALTVCSYTCVVAIKELNPIQRHGLLLQL